MLVFFSGQGRNHAQQSGADKLSQGVPSLKGALSPVRSIGLIVMLLGAPPCESGVTACERVAPLMTVGAPTRENPGKRESRLCNVCHR